MTSDFRTHSTRRMFLSALMVSISIGSTATAKNNDEFSNTCEAESLSPKDFVECLCDKEGGIFWETDTEFGCWQLEPGEFDYRCLKGQPLSSCIVTQPAVDPPDEEPGKRPITGARPGGPGSGEVAPVDSSDSGLSVPDFEIAQQSNALDVFAQFDASRSNEEVGELRASSDNDPNADNEASDQQIESPDTELMGDSSDDSVNQVDPSSEPTQADDSSPDVPVESIDSQIAGPCGAGAGTATVMLIASLSLIGKLPLVGRRRRV